MGRKLSPGVHNIRIKKPGGGTRMQRVKVLKSGKFKFIKNKPGGGGKRAAKPRAKAKLKKSKARSSARGGNTGRRKQGLASKVTSAVALLIGLSPVLRFLPLLTNPQEFARQMTRIYTGWNGQTFNPVWLAEGYAPIAGGVAFKKGMGALIKHAPLKV